MVPKYLKAQNTAVSKDYYVHNESPRSKLRDISNKEDCGVSSSSIIMVALWQAMSLK
jgi:hypothetical protein